MMHATKEVKPTTVEFASHYRPTARLVLDLVEEICERATADLQTLGLDPLPVAGIAVKALAVRTAVEASEKANEETFHLAGGLLDTVRTGCSVYLDKLGKLRKAQLKLGIADPDDTDGAISHAQALADEANVQLSLLR